MKISKDNVPVPARRRETGKVAAVDNSWPRRRETSLPTKTENGRLLKIIGSRATQQTDALGKRKSLYIYILDTSYVVVNCSLDPPNFTLSVWNRQQQQQQPMKPKKQQQQQNNNNNKKYNDGYVCGFRLAFWLFKERSTWFWISLVRWQDPSEREGYTTVISHNHIMWKEMDLYIHLVELTSVDWWTPELLNLISSLSIGKRWIRSRFPLTSRVYGFNIHVRWSQCDNYPPSVCKYMQPRRK